MGLHDPFKYLQHKLWLKERLESKCQFDSWPLKVGNCLELFAFKWCAAYIWKTFNKGYNLSLYFALNRGFHKKLWAFEMAGVLILKFSRLLIWET